MNCILIIDDDPTVLNLFEQYLTRAGYFILTAANGREGIRLFREAGPDLVITDIMMPEMDGLEILMTIRREHASVPVIAVSGGMRNAPVSFLHHARIMGARHVFEKPVALDTLLEAVRELLAENRDPSSGPPSCST